MGCTASRAVAPIDGSDAHPASPGVDVSSGPPGPFKSLLAEAAGNVSAEAIVQFTDEASAVLDTITAAPDVLANFSQFLQDHAGDLRDAVVAIGGAAAMVASTAACMTPAAVIVAPALAAVRILASQVVAMHENKELAEAIHAELAYADTLLMHAGRSEPLARDHAPLLTVICGSARNAAALVQRISRRGAFMSFVSAGADGAALRAALSDLHDRFAALGTAAAVAGAMGVSELPAAVVEKLRLALRQDASDASDQAVARVGRASAAPGVAVSEVPSAAQAEISESRLAVQWESPYPGSGNGADDVFPGVLFSSDAVATDEPGSGAAVIVKVLGGTGARPDSTAVRRFLLNARLQMRLTAAMGCVAAHGVCVMSAWGGHRLVAFVQERMAVSLDDVLQSRALSSRVALSAALTVCDAVAQLHSALPFIIHGDLRAQGGRVGSGSESGVPRMDAGRYLAPESWGGGGAPQSRAADVWAVAALSVFIISRVPPFANATAALSGLPTSAAVDAVRSAALRGEPPYTPAQLASLLPVAPTDSSSTLAAFLTRCWAIEPADRPDALELADALHAAVVAAGGNPHTAAAIPLDKAIVEAASRAFDAASTVVPSDALARSAAEAAALLRRGGSGGGGGSRSSAFNQLAAADGADGISNSSKLVVVQWNSMTYFFRGERYWRLHPSGSRMDAGYPLSISGQWGVPGPIDAALTWRQRTYLFRGTQYWRLNAAGNAPDPGYPLSIECEWGVPGPIDAAMEWNGRTYFFRGENYWRLNAAGNAPDRGYPMPIEREWGVPGPIDSAFVWNGRTYIFRGDSYWRLNAAGNAPDAGYPMSIEREWGLPSEQPASATRLAATQVHRVPDRSGATAAASIATDAVSGPQPAGGAAVGIHVVEATYGIAGRDRDVIAVVRSLIASGSTSAAISVDNTTLGGDPAPNVAKRLRVTYSLNGAAHVRAEAPEGSLLRLGAGSGLCVIRAAYGIAGREQDVAPVVRSLIVAGSTSVAIPVDNATLGGDPAPNHLKRLRVTYSLEGAAPVGTEAREGSVLHLPLL